MFGTGVQQNLLNIWKGNGRTAENKPYLFQCSLTNAVVFNAQAFTAFFQGTKDVRPAQLLIIYLVMEQALQRENTPPTLNDKSLTPSTFMITSLIHRSYMSNMNLEHTNKIKLNKIL